MSYSICGVIILSIFVTIVKNLYMLNNFVTLSFRSKDTNIIVHDTQKHFTEVKNNIKKMLYSIISLIEKQKNCIHKIMKLEENINKRKISNVNKN